MILIHVAAREAFEHRDDFVTARREHVVDPISERLAAVPGIEVTELHISTQYRTAVIGIESVESPGRQRLSEFTADLDTAGHQRERRNRTASEGRSRPQLAFAPRKWLLERAF